MTPAATGAPSPTHSEIELPAHTGSRTTRWLGLVVLAGLAALVLLGFFAFYLTLDLLFAAVFAVLGAILVTLAMQVGALPLGTAGGIAAACFFGGYALQFVGHAVEKSMPVLVKHPIQAQLAAPFFTVVELFKILHLREDLFDEVQRRIASLREEETAAT